VVYGYPSEVELDVAISDEKVILVEVTSHVRASDVYEFKRETDLYSKVVRLPSRLLPVTPYAEEKAIEAAKGLGIEVYTGV